MPVEERVMLWKDYGVVCGVWRHDRTGMGRRPVASVHVASMPVLDVTLAELGQELLQGREPLVGEHDPVFCLVFSGDRRAYCRSEERFIYSSH